MIDDLVAFLRERLDEDERIAREAADDTASTWDDNGLYGETVTAAGAGGFVACGPWGNDVPWELRQHIARHDPARVLAEVGAKRRIIAECESAYNQDNWGMSWMADQALAMLALPYAGRPDYRPDWAPDAEGRSA